MADAVRLNFIHKAHNHIEYTFLTVTKLVPNVVLTQDSIHNFGHTVRYR